LGMRPSRSRAKLSTSALGFDEDFSVGAFAVVDEGEVNILIDVEQGADVDLVPSGVSRWCRSER